MATRLGDLPAGAGKALNALVPAAGRARAISPLRGFVVSASWARCLACQFSASLGGLCGWTPVVSETEVSHNPRVAVFRPLLAPRWAGPAGEFLRHFGFLHNIQVPTNVYKIGMTARGGGRDNVLGRTNETSPSVPSL